MDMAICMVLFNPVNSKRMLMNYHFVVNEFKLQNFPVFTLELIYPDRTPQIADAIHVKSNSIMFHKENMYRVLEKYVHPKFTKIACLDSDIIFKDKQWYSKTSKLLDSYDVVHPFETSSWLDLSYKTIVFSRKSFVLLNSANIDWNYHPGFGWCFRREWYKKVGYFDYCLSGGGDTTSCVMWMKLIYKPGTFLSNNVADLFKEYVNSPKPRITFLKDSVVYHLHHGSRKNRQYVVRSKIFDGCPDIREMILTNDHGIYEWKDEYRAKMNQYFLKYLTDRGDDDLNS